jgi:preprotein translocase subunit SecE
MAATNTTTTTPPSVDSRGGLGEYLRGVREELKKAVWPTKDELVRLTQIVLLLIAVVALYCGAIDGALGLITNRLFNRS